MLWLYRWTIHIFHLQLTCNTRKEDCSGSVTCDDINIGHGCMSDTFFPRLFQVHDKLHLTWLFQYHTCINPQPIQSHKQISRVNKDVILASQVNEGLILKNHVILSINWKYNWSSYYTGSCLFRDHYRQVSMKCQIFDLIIIQWNVRYYIWHWILTKYIFIYLNYIVNSSFIHLWIIVKRW